MHSKGTLLLKQGKAYYSLLTKTLSFIPMKHRTLKEEFNAYNKDLRRRHLHEFQLTYAQFLRQREGKSIGPAINTNKKPVLGVPSWAFDPYTVPSGEATDYIPAKESMMDRAIAGKESKEVTEAILHKAKRIAPEFNKGASQYITEGSDLTQLGKKVK